LDFKHSKRRKTRMKGNHSVVKITASHKAFFADCVHALLS
jgi:hypothetical protein